jgi:hypothetical protein
MYGTRTVRSSSALVLLLLLVAACSGGSGTSGASQSVNISLAPSTESATTEAPQHDGGGISIEVVSLPIGGNANSVGAQQCADVGLTNVPDPLPSDVSISVTGVSLDPAAIFAVGGDRTTCAQTAPDDEPTCGQTWEWTAGDVGRCVLVVTQLVDSDQAVTLNLAGDIHCTKQSSCNAIKDAGTSQIQFQAQPGVLSSSSGDSSPSAPDTGAST